MKFIFRVLAAIIGRLGDKMPDDLYLKIRYRLIMGRKLDLETPQSFNEKLNWLKIYYRDERYTSFADKATVKDYVEKQIGKEYIIPTYGVWNTFEEIDFDNLPNEFILKSTNGGGGTGVVVCRDKKTFDKENAKKLLEKSMRSCDKIQREWVYYDIKPRIIAEKLMKNDDGSEIVDYKIMCFNGVPKLLFQASDRYTPGEHLKFDWYDENLNHLPAKSEGYPNTTKTLKMFPEFDEMKKVAAKLSEGMPHVRVDLYLINGKIYFGELTFFHDGAFVPIEPYEWDLKFGSYLQLPSKNRYNG